MLKLIISQINPDIYESIKNKLISNKNFVQGRPKTNEYITYIHKDYGVKLSFDLRKVRENNTIVGYREISINICPHYSKNGYKHNGDDFSPIQCIIELRKIFNLLQFDDIEIKHLSVVNLETGINFLSKFYKQYINSIYFTSRTAFIRDAKNHYSLKSKGSRYKYIKVYAKGLQFQDFPEYNISQNTIRFEIKIKRRTKIENLGILNAGDLLRIESYNALFQAIIDEWEKILVINLNTEIKYYENVKDKNFIEECKDYSYWENLVTDQNRNKFSLYKNRYYSTLRKEDNLHNIVKKQIIDKFTEFNHDANCHHAAGLLQ